jgi:hypothetical protein
VLCALCVCACLRARACVLTSECSCVACALLSRPSPSTEATHQNKPKHTKINPAPQRMFARPCRRWASGADAQGER